MASKRKRQASRRKGSGAQKQTSSTRPSISRSAQSDLAFEAKQRAFHAVARMRSDGLSLNAASREEGTTSATVKKYLPAALRQSRTGKWTATKRDRYARTLILPGTHGPVTVHARGSSEAQLASTYLASLARWARNNRLSELAPFFGKRVGNFELLTAPRSLRALRDAGLLQLDSLYAALKETV
jgi:hypothetical protein